jgi:hypothetical protein
MSLKYPFLNIASYIIYFSNYSHVVTGTIPGRDLSCLKIDV